MLAKLENVEERTDHLPVAQEKTRFLFLRGWKATMVLGSGCHGSYTGNAARLLFFIFRTGAISAVFLCFALIVACQTKEDDPATEDPQRDAEFAAVQEDLLVYASCYFLNDDAEYLSRLMEAPRYKRNMRDDSYDSLRHFAAYKTQGKRPAHRFDQLRLDYLIKNEKIFRETVIGLTPKERLLCAPKAMSRPTIERRGLRYLLTRTKRSGGELSEIIQLLRVKKGDTVADIGFGDGQITVAIAKQVGKRGRVIGVEIQPSLVAFLNMVAAEEHLPQLVARRGRFNDTGLLPITVDVAFLRYVFGEKVREEDAFNLLVSIRRSLKPGGRVLLIEDLPEHHAPSQVLEESGFTWLTPKLLKHLCVKAGMQVEKHRKMGTKNNNIFRLRKLTAE